MRVTSFVTTAMDTDSSQQIQPGPPNAAISIDVAVGLSAEIREAQRNVRSTLKKKSVASRTHKRPELIAKGCEPLLLDPR
jgi:hypothetical protein